MATIRYLAEKALTDYLTACSLGLTIYQGTGSGTKDSPAVVVTATDWQEDEYALNWFRVTCTVEVKMAASDGTAATYDGYCSSVRSALRITDLGTQLNALAVGATFTGRGASAADKGTFMISEDTWINSTEVELYCTLSAWCVDAYQ